MEPFVRHTGLVAPLDRANVDTDAIIPKQFLKRIERTGFGQFLFFDWRFQPDSGAPNPAFVLNSPRYQGASILVAQKNFGCGSSREHAPWALQDYGFKGIIAPSFADIFYNNCFKIGILPVVLPEDAVAAIMDRARTREGYQVTLDLAALQVTDSQGLAAAFTVDDFRRHCLLHGLDDIGLTLKHEGKIAAYEAGIPAWRHPGGHRG